MDNLAGIEHVGGIEGGFHFTECIVDRRSEHLFLEGRPHQSIAVFTGKGAAVFQHQIGHFRGDGLKAFHTLRALQIDDGPNVQQPNRCVRIEAGLCVIFRQNLLEVFDVIPQALRRHRSIFDERDRLGVAGLGHRQPQRGAAQLPDAGLFLCLKRTVEIVAQPARIQVRLQALNLAAQFLFRLAKKFHQQHRARVAMNKAAQWSKFDPAAGLVQHKAVDQLDCGRTVFQDHRGGAHRLQQVGELHAAQGAAGR